MEGLTPCFLFKSELVFTKNYGIMSCIPCTAKIFLDTTGSFECAKKAGPDPKFTGYCSAVLNTLDQSSFFLYRACLIHKKWLVKMHMQRVCGNCGFTVQKTGCDLHPGKKTKLMC